VKLKISHARTQGQIGGAVGLARAVPAVRVAAVVLAIVALMALRFRKRDFVRQRRVVMR
jgi:hypothetical protein